jgi:hypothetical protein
LLKKGSEKNAQEEPKGRPQEVRGDRVEPASLEAHEAGRCEGQQEEAREINPAAEINKSSTVLYLGGRTDP